MLSSAHIWGAAELYGIPRGKPVPETDTPRLAKDERVRPGTWRTAPKGPLPVGPDGNVILPQGKRIQVLKPVAPKVIKPYARIAPSIEVAVSDFNAVGSKSAEIAAKRAELDVLDAEAANQFHEIALRSGRRTIGGIV